MREEKGGGTGRQWLDVSPIIIAIISGILLNDFALEWNLPNDLRRRRRSQMRGGQGRKEKSPSRVEHSPQIWEVHGSGT
jgi:hypothetical protein